MIHHYSVRKFDNYGRPIQGRSSCTKTYMPWESDKNWTSVPHNTTCPSCLKVLIPVIEEKLEQMKKNLERAEAILQ